MQTNVRTVQAMFRLTIPGWIELQQRAAQEYMSAVVIAISPW
jgi:hypothetical protein